MGARFCSVGLKDFFLANTMKNTLYIKLYLGFIPENIIRRYNLDELVVDGYVYMNI